MGFASAQVGFGSSVQLAACLTELIIDGLQERKPLHAVLSPLWDCHNSLLIQKCGPDVLLKAPHVKRKNKTAIRMMMMKSIMILRCFMGSVS